MSDKTIVQALPERFQSLSGVKRKLFIVEATEYLYVSPDMEWVQENIPYEEREQYDHRVWETLRESNIVYDYAKKTPSLIEISDNDNFGGDNLFYEAHYKFKVLAKDEQQAKEKVQESLYGGYDTQSSAFHTQTKLFKKEFENLLGIPVIIEEGEVEFGDIYPYDEEEDKRLKVALEKETQKHEKREAQQAQLRQDHMYTLMTSLSDVASKYFSQDTATGLGEDVSLKSSTLPQEIKDGDKQFYSKGFGRVIEFQYNTYAPPTNEDYRKEDLWVVYGLGEDRLFEGSYFQDAKINVYRRKIRKGSKVMYMGSFSVTIPEWFKDGDDITKEIQRKLDTVLYYTERKEAVEKKRKSLKVYPLVKKGKSSRIYGQGKLAPYYTQYYIGDKPEADAHLIREVQGGDFGKVITLEYRVEPLYPDTFPEKSFKADDKNLALLYLYEQLDILHRKEKKKEKKEPKNWRKSFGTVLRENREGLEEYFDNADNKEQMELAQYILDYLDLGAHSEAIQEYISKGEDYIWYHIDDQAGNIAVTYHSQGEKYGLTVPEDRFEKDKWLPELQKWSGEIDLIKTSNIPLDVQNDLISWYDQWDYLDSLNKFLQNNTQIRKLIDDIYLKPHRQTEEIIKMIKSEMERTNNKVKKLVSRVAEALNEQLTESQNDRQIFDPDLRTAQRDGDEAVKQNRYAEVLKDIIRSSNPVDKLDYEIEFYGKKIRNDTEIKRSIKKAQQNAPNGMENLVNTVLDLRADNFIYTMLLILKDKVSK